MGLSKARKKKQRTIKINLIHIILKMIIVASNNKFKLIEDVSIKIIEHELW